MENEMIEVVRKLRENAIIELASENKEFLNALEKYLCVSVYNNIKGIDTTIKNMIKESKAKKELKEIMDIWEPAIKAKTFQFIEEYSA